MIPAGDLVRSRIVEDAAQPLRDALDRRHSGYAVLEPAEGVLLNDGARAVLTFEHGVPVLAYHVGTGRGGPGALGVVGAGPYRCWMYAVPARALAAAHAADRFRVQPGAPAKRLAGDDALADRTRRAAPEGLCMEDGTDAVEAFLDDADRIAEIKRGARREAARRAEEWGFADAVDGSGSQKETSSPCRGDDDERSS